VTEAEQKVAIITGGSQGIGVGIVEAYRQRGWAVVANSLSIKPSKDPDILTVRGDVSEQATADQIMSKALDRFGRVDTLVNNAGVFVSKPFIDYTAEDYALVTGVNLAGFFWLTQRAIGQMLTQHGGHVVNMSASIAAHAVIGHDAMLQADATARAEAPGEERAKLGGAAMGQVRADELAVVPVRRKSVHDRVSDTIIQ
jgi:NAD(P)-dependent dehydrogenase (short-subunit alcohol dehydrogenase family)